MALKALKSNFTGRAAALALSAATVLSPMASTPAYADDASQRAPASYFTGPGESELYSHGQIFAPQAPTASRPYYQYNFDAETLRDYPDFSPHHIALFDVDKMVVFNYQDLSPQGRRYSAMQDEVLERSLLDVQRLAGDKEIVLVNVVVKDEAGRNVYGADYISTFETYNRLGSNNSRREDLILPYGATFGHPLREGGSRMLYDFSLINGVRTNADLNENAEAIHLILANIGNMYKRQQTASLDNVPGHPSLVAANH